MTKEYWRDPLFCKIYRRIHKRKSRKNLNINVLETALKEYRKTKDNISMIKEYTPQTEIKPNSHTDTPQIKESIHHKHTRIKWENADYLVETPDGKYVNIPHKKKPTNKLWNF